MSTEPAASSSSSETTVPPFSYYANAQSTFQPPLIANGNAFLGDVFSTSDLSRPNPMSAGFYRLQPGPELVYTYTYDEMKILVEGDMQIAQLASAEDAKGDGKDAEMVKAEVDAKKGDTFFFPKGAVVRFRTREGGLAWFCGARARDGA
ncbi:MAG: hypothetical protein Q9185_004596 [Variospora sp. 1 TL-2023]